MQMELSLVIINVFLMIIVFLMALGYTFTQAGPSVGWPGKTKYAMYGVFSFVMIGVIFMSYMVWLYISTGLDFSYIFTIRDREFDLANGFFTVLVGTFVGLSLGLFALLKKQEGLGR